MFVCRHVIYTAIRPIMYLDKLQWTNNSHEAVTRSRRVFETFFFYSSGAFDVPVQDVVRRNYIERRRRRGRARKHGVKEIDCGITSRREISYARRLATGPPFVSWMNNYIHDHVFCAVFPRMVRQTVILMYTGWSQHLPRCDGCALISRAAFLALRLNCLARETEFSAKHF